MRAAIRPGARRQRGARLRFGRLAADGRAGGRPPGERGGRLRIRPRSPGPPRPTSRRYSVHADASPWRRYSWRGAGSTTLFRWGNDCPLDRSPYGDQAGPQQEPNALGLRIAYDSYRTELTSDVTAVHGGDGGESVCGGYGGLLEWLPLATADRNPFQATEFVHSPIGEDMYHLFATRPVLAL